MKMHLTPLKINDAYVIEQSGFMDDRGHFSRVYCQEQLTSVLQSRILKQVNFSETVQAGTVRGLHYQLPPFEEVKMVRCISGSVWDVVVDLRPQSSTFLQWHAQELNAENKLMMLIPEGCAHGFQAIHNNSELLYFHTALYSSEYERGINVEDQDLAIEWPLAVSGLSERDKSLPTIQDVFSKKVK